jgi:transposase InsO family protein
MGKGKLDNAGSFSLTYNLPYYFLKYGSRRVYMGELTSTAKTRLAFIEFHHQVRDVSLTCKVFKISRETFYKWKTRFNPCNLSTLEDQSKAPVNRRKGRLSLEEEQELKKYRNRYIRIGKVKLSRMYQKEYGKEASSWQFQKVIQKYELYYDKIKARRLKIKKDKRRGAQKTRINTVNPKDYISESKPFFICVDTIVLYLPWGKRYIVTALDHFNRLGFARTYSTKSSLSALDFLLRLNALVEGKIAAILSDNGSEFAKYFDEACRRLKIVHLYTRVRTPKDNPKDERFNRTVKEEFIEVNECFEGYLAARDLTEANRELTDWIIFYNFKRPHQALDYLTPMEYITNIQQVSAMYPSHTFY